MELCFFFWVWMFFLEGLFTFWQGWLDDQRGHLSSMTDFTAIDFKSLVSRHLASSYFFQHPTFLQGLWPNTSSYATTCLSSMVYIFAFLSMPLMNSIPKTSASSFSSSLFSIRRSKVWFSEGVRFSFGFRKIFLHYSKRFCLLERCSFLRIIPE